MVDDATNGGSGDDNGGGGDDMILLLQWWSRNSEDMGERKREREGVREIVMSVCERAGVGGIR